MGKPPATEGLRVRSNTEAWAFSVESEGPRRERERFVDAENTTDWEAPGFFAFDQSSSQRKVSLFAYPGKQKMASCYRCCHLHRCPPETNDAEKAVKSPKALPHSYEIWGWGTP